MGTSTDNWQVFLESMGNDSPAYGMVSWDGQSRQVAQTVQFTRPGVKEAPAVVRERARRYFSQFGPAERAVVVIEVHKRDGVPIWAVIRPRSQAVWLGTGRLRELGEALEP